MHYLFPDSPNVYKPLKPMGNNYWEHDKNKYILIEEYAASKLMYFEEKAYDPSMRIFLLMNHSRGKISINVLNGYWKLPPHSLDDDVPLSQKNKTDPTTHKFMGIGIEPKDLAILKKILHQFLPDLYVKMLKQYKYNFKNLFRYNFIK